VFGGGGGRLKSKLKSFSSWSVGTGLVAWGSVAGGSWGFVWPGEGLLAQGLAGGFIVMMMSGTSHCEVPYSSAVQAWVVMGGEGLGSNTDESSGLLVGRYRADGFGFFGLRNRGRLEDDWGLPHIGAEALPHPKEAVRHKPFVLGGLIRCCAGWCGDGGGGPREQYR
jgi:hypothetical protein